jgi:hypothetical protein
MVVLSKIDISENTLRNRGRVLDILLIDRTRYKPSRPYNIIWATDSYLKRGKNYAPTKQIKREQVTGANGKLIQPRAAKSIEEQKYRTKDKAEVFTPLKIVKKMNMAIDWASKNWPVGQDNWVDYISERRLEITCGEAPFIAGRYNPTAHTGIVINPSNRVGFFDRKLQYVSKYAKNKKEWLNHAEIALKATYGYEWQGDNLLIARENVLLTIDDFYKDFCSNRLKLKSKQNLTDAQLEHFAEIISWNIFQMDGLSMTIPYTGHNKKVVDNVDKGNTLFDINSAQILVKKNITCPDCTLYGKNTHKPKYVEIKDWQTGKSIKFINIIKD